MPKTLKVIVKSPSDVYGRYEEIENSLEAMQKVVGGYIETIPVSGKTILVCNEEGKLKGLEPNLPYYGDVIVGTVFLCDIKGADMVDISMSLDEWRGIVEEQRRTL